jgi:putative transposase
MLRAFEIKLYPNSGQKKYLATAFGCYRKVYNICLQKSIDEYEKGNSFCGLQKMTNFFHQELLKDKEFYYLTEHNTKILKDSIKNLSKAFNNFFKNYKKGVGYPNFKKRNDKQTIGIYGEAFSKKVFYKQNFMFISKSFGEIKYKTSKEYKEIIEKYKDEIKRITIVKNKSGEYFAKVLIDYKGTKQKEKNTNIIAIDLGIKNFVISSEAEIFENKKFMQKEEKQIKKLQRNLDRKLLVKTDKTYFNKKYQKDIVIKAPSKNREKARIKLAKKHQKVRDRQKNNLHMVTNSLINDNQVIIMEDLDVKTLLKNKTIAKSIHEMNWGEFKIMLTYKSIFYDRSLIKVDKYFPSSKKCSECDYIKQDLKLEDREWTCSNCNTHHDRDYNSTINLIIEGLNILIGNCCPEFKLGEIDKENRVEILKNIYWSLTQEEN